MSGDWIKFETATPDKPEVWAIAELLKLDPDAVVGKLLRVWIWADSQTEDGSVSVTPASRSQRDICHASVTHKIVDRHVGVQGFADAMESVGWLNPDGSFPCFERHNGKSAKNRALTAERQRRRRDTAVTQSSRSERDKSVTREEKRRDITPQPPLGGRAQKSAGEKNGSGPRPPPADPPPGLDPRIYAIKSDPSKREAWAAYERQQWFEEREAARRQGAVQ